MLNFYLYSVSALTLATSYAATLIFVDGLLRYLFGVDTGYASREAMANGLGFALVATPLWLVHWRWLGRLSADSEPTTGHRFYLFTVVCLNAVAVMVAGSIGVTGLLRLLLGLEWPAANAAVSVGVALMACGLSAWLWWHHVRALGGRSPLRLGLRVL